MILSFFSNHLKQVGELDEAYTQIYSSPLKYPYTLFLHFLKLVYYNI